MTTPENTEVKLTEVELAMLTMEAMDKKQAEIDKALATVATQISGAQAAIKSPATDGLFTSLKALVDKHTWADFLPSQLLKFNRTEQKSFSSGWKESSEPGVEISMSIAFKYVGVEASEAGSEAGEKQEDTGASAGEPKPKLDANGNPIAKTRKAGQAS